MTHTNSTGPGLAGRNRLGTNLTGKLIAALWWLGIFSGVAAANVWLWRAALGL